MSRRKRIIQAGYPYHVMLRGNGGQLIFCDNEDRIRFCLLMQYAIERHNITVHGFCLMDNHVHLLFEPTTKGLSMGVHACAFRYAQYFNNKYNRRGHLFQGRYKRVIVQHGLYLRRVIRYIHRNPVRAQMVTRPDDYKWSSHSAYLGRDEYTWLLKDRVLAMFEVEEAKRDAGIDSCTIYNSYISADDADASDQLDAIRRSSNLGAYGDIAFVKKFSDNNIDELELAFITENGSHETRLADLLRAVCEKFEISEEHLCGASRELGVVRARAVLTLIATRCKLTSLSALAMRLSRDHSSLSRLRQKAENDKILIQAGKEIIDSMIAL